MDDETKRRRAQQAATILQTYEIRYWENAISMENIVETFLADLMLYCELRFDDGGFEQRLASARASLYARDTFLS